MHLRADDVLALFGRICDDTTAALAATTDWGETTRRGQYRVDLDLDALCVQPLLAAGVAVLSEESGLVVPDGAARAAIDDGGVVDGRDPSPRIGQRAEAAMVVVDPLDGSTNAALGVPWCATALCLVVDGTAEVAMVANLRTGERFWAVRSAGAWHRPTEPRGIDAGAPSRVLSLHGREPVPLRDAIVATSGLFDAHWGWRQYRAMGAAALDICSVARGGFDAFVDVDDDAHGVWDYLAAALVLTEAGGVVADALGRELLVLDHAARRTPVAAGDGALLDELLARRTRR